MAGIRWSTDPKVLANRYTEYGEKVVDLIGSVCDTHAQVMQSEAQANAPWQDRTGDARRGIKGTSQKTADGGIITLAHTVPYGPYLENGTSRMAARPIIMPTMQANYGRLMSRLQSLIS